MIGSKWNRGLPRVSGNYFIMDGNGSNLRFVSAVKLPDGTIRVFAGSAEVAEADGIVSYGPVPGVERSLSSARRKDAPAEPVEA